jgi:predicted MFS family arabinose efflux permease
MTIDTRRVGIALAGYCAFLNLYAPQALLPALAHNFGVTAAEISTVMTAGTLSIAISAPFTGVVTDMLGRKRVIIIAMLAVALPTVMVALATDVHQIVLWRFIQGLALPPVFATALAYVGDEFPPAEVAGVAGIYMLGSSLGGFSGRLIPGLLTDLVGWRIAIGSLAVVTVVCALMFGLALDKERHFVRSEGLGASLRQMLRHLVDRRLIPIYAVGFGVLFNFMAVFTYVNFHLAGAPYFFSPSMLGLIFLTYLVGSATVPSIGRAVAAFGRRRFVLGVLAGWAAGAALLLTPAVWSMLLGLTLCAMCGMMCQGVSAGAVTATAKDGRSSAVGLYMTVFYVGGSAGASLPGLAWALGGWPATVGMVLAVIVLMAAVVVAFWRDATA